MLAQAASAEVEVTSCGQIVEASGYLSADLDCTGFTQQPFAVLVEPGGSLDLGGFTIRGAQSAVLCGSVEKDELGQTLLKLRGRCTITNGTITGAAVGIGAERLRAANLDVVDNTEGGIVESNRGRFVIADSTISGNGYCGVLVNNVKVVRSDVHGNAAGGICTDLRMRVIDSSVVGNGIEPCTEGPCADVSSRLRPRLRDSVCEHSYGKAEGLVIVSWDICSLD